jgi:hypothetical protein
VANKNPTPGEITVMAGGAVALIFSFFDFYTSDSVTVAGRTFEGASATVWSNGLFPVATLMVLFAVIAGALVAVGRFSGTGLRTLPMGFSWEQLYFILGLVATIYAIAYLIVDKGGLSFGVGFWFVLIGCIATLVGAALIARERTSGAVPPTP